MNLFCNFSCYIKHDVQDVRGVTKQLFLMMNITENAFMVAGLGGKEVCSKRSGPGFLCKFCKFSLQHHCNGTNTNMYTNTNANSDSNTTAMVQLW